MKEGSPDTVLANTEVNVLQAVNLTLGTGGFLALADGLPKLVGQPTFEWDAEPDWLLIAKVVYAGLLVFWMVKLLAQNHRGFAREYIRLHPGYAVFQLVMTVLVFMALIASARQVHENFAASADWLTISMALGGIWLAGQLLRFKPFGADEFKWAKYSWWWVLSIAVSLVGSFLMPDKNACLILAAVTTMIAALAYDTWRSGTFSVKRASVCQGTVAILKDTELTD